MKTYRIRPLEWEEYGNGIMAEPGLRCSYRVWPYSNGDGTWSLVSCGADSMHTKHDTLEAAKSAAQAHWEQQLSQVLEVVE